MTNTVLKPLISPTSAINGTEHAQTCLFEQTKVRRAFDKSAARYQQFALLQNEVSKRLLEKLDTVKISPKMILDAGTGTGSAIGGLYARYKTAQIIAFDLSENMLFQTKKQAKFFKTLHRVCGDVEALPFADNSFDLVFSSLCFQWCNNLNQALLEAKRVLKPGGLFVFTTFGPDTLKELRQSWAQVDGASHVNHFIDMHDIGDALLQDNFAQPVMSSEQITVTYDSVDLLMHDLKAIGANVTKNSAKGLNTKSALNTVRKAYEQFRTNNVLPASYEVIYGHAWKASEKDQTNESQCFVELK